MDTGLSRDRLPADSGVYVFWLEQLAPARLELPALGDPLLRPGHYAYVGSARGPGGLRARLGRHIEGPGTRRWHIDVLRRTAVPREAWYGLSAACGAERDWVGALSRLPGVTPGVAGFGASDSPAATHLFHAPRIPSSGAFARALGDGISAVGGVTRIRLAVDDSARSRVARRSPAG